jgi:hypothetical protein
VRNICNNILLNSETGSKHLTKRRDNGKDKAETRPHVQAKKHEAERKEFRTKNVNHQRNRQALDRNFPSSPQVRDLVEKELQKEPHRAPLPSLQPTSGPAHLPSGPTRAPKQTAQHPHGAKTSQRNQEFTSLTIFKNGSTSRVSPSSDAL